MKFSAGSVIEMNDIRTIVRTIRRLGATWEDDGYYHIELHLMDYLHLLQDVKTQELLNYMTEESRIRATKKKEFQGIYGALVTVWEPKNVEAEEKV